jgi:hypothetical protein
VRLISVAAQRFLAQVRRGSCCLSSALPASCPALALADVLAAHPPSHQVLEEAHNAHKLRQLAPAPKLKEAGCAGWVWGMGAGTP